MINSLRKWILVSGFSINLTHFRSSKIQYLFWVNKWTTKSYLLRHREASGEFFKLIKNIKWGGNSLAVEWLGFCNFTAEGTGSVPAQGTKILQTAQDDIYIYEKWKLLVAQSCLTLCNLMDCSPPFSSVHGILQARTLELGSCSLLQGNLPTQGSNPGLLHYRQILVKNPWVRKIPWRREQLPIPVFWPGEFHGLYGVAKSNTTERLSLHIYIYIYSYIYI